LRIVADPDVRHQRAVAIGARIASSQVRLGWSELRWRAVIGALLSAGRVATARVRRCSMLEQRRALPRR